MRSLRITLVKEGKGQWGVRIKRTSILENRVAPEAHIPRGQLKDAVLILVNKTRGQA